MLWTTPQMIEGYRLALLRLVAGLLVMAGIEPGKDVAATLPRHVRAAILKVLRQAESAARRLVVLEARDLDVPAYVPRQKREKTAPKGAAEKTGATRIPRFCLIDPRKFLEELYPNRRVRQPGKRRERHAEPRLLFRIAGVDGQPDYEEWSEPEPEMSHDDPLNAARICRRMQALHHALSDLPKQARRLVRELAKRNAAPPGPGRVPPLRAGLPPGHRNRQIHEVDEILRDCHWLAMRDAVPPDGVLATG